MLKNNKRDKGFTLIELVVVIAIMAILAAIMTPNLTAYITKAENAVINTNLKTVYDAASIVDQTTKGMKLTKSSTASEPFILEVNKYANIKDSELSKYTIGKNDKGIYVEYLDNKGVIHKFPKSYVPGKPDVPGKPGDVYIATDNDFLGSDNGAFKYIGTELEVKIPHIIKGVNITSYERMFQETSVTKVVSDNPNITNMFSMFYNSKAATLSLSLLNTSNVTNMSNMFASSEATTIDLSSFDTANVTDMSDMFADSHVDKLNFSSFNTSKVNTTNGMFYSSKATSLNLSSFNTSNVTDMSSMFQSSEATSLNLSSFNTSNVTDMWDMFRYSKATKLDLSSFNTGKVDDMGYVFQGSEANIGYARNIAEANKYNDSVAKAIDLTFTVR